MVRVIWNICEMAKSLIKIIPEMFVSELADLNLMIDFFLFRKEYVLSTTELVHRLDYQQLVFSH
jgi:hypothetical protein